MSTRAPTSPFCHAERLQQLSELLTRHRPLWVCRPFTVQPTPWEAEHPQVAQWLRRLSAAQIDAAESATGALPDAPAEWKLWQRQISALCTLPQPQAHPSQQRGRGVKHRKWLQICAFSQALRPMVPPDLHQLVDWCGGKGHLGRYLSTLTGLPTTVLERNDALCRAGTQLSTAAELPCQHVRQDILEATAEQWLRPQSGVVGLHACGALGDRLLTLSLKRAPALVALASCCYHKSADPKGRFRPLSQQGQRLDLKLDAGLLRLPSADEQNARARLRATRRRSMAWRLGLDLLVREATGQDRYTPLGTLKRSVFDLPFADFVKRTSAELALPLPHRWDPANAERHGQERARLARALGLARAIHRRPLELWLNLDRVRFLEEAGRRAQLLQFCAPKITPRNIMIVSQP